MSLIATLHRFNDTLKGTFTIRISFYLPYIGACFNGSDLMCVSTREVVIRINKISPGHRVRGRNSLGNRPQWTQGTEKGFVLLDASISEARKSERTAFGVMAT